MGFRRRLLLLFLLAAGAAALIWLRVAQLQLVEAGRWRRAADRAREQTASLEPRRGAIVDALGRALVQDEPVLQLALVPREWRSRERLRCEACGLVHFLEPGKRRPKRCRCKAGVDQLVPLGMGDLGPLEELLGLPAGRIAAIASERQSAIDALVAAEARRLSEEDGEDFLTEDRLEVFREQKEELPIPLLTDVPEAAVRLVSLDELGVTRGLLLRHAHRRTAGQVGGSLARVLGQSRPPESEEDLRRLQELFPEGDIDGRTLMGVAGLERRYDEVLRGRSGRERRARDDQGAFSVVVESEPPTPGRRLRLSARLEDNALAQRALAALPALAAGYAPRTRPSGALVAMDAVSGEILALAELPELLPEDVAHGARKGAGRVWPLCDREAQAWVPAQRVPGPALVDTDRERVLAEATGFQRLLLPWRLQPSVLEAMERAPEGLDLDAWRATLSLPAGAVLSRVSQMAVEPGSTLKPFIGLAMLEAGLGLPIEGEFACSGRHGKPGCHPHGAVDFEGALCQSCNQYFAYSLRNFRSHWPVFRTRVAAFLDRLGFGHLSGSDLDGESRGRWLRAAEWGLEETPTIHPESGQNVAIGQGEVLATPLQMVRAVAALANGGRLVTPHLGRSLEAPDGRVEPLSFPTQDLDLDASHLARVRDGMRRVIYDAQGTAYGSFPWGTIPGRVYGKTGTAQVGRSFKPFEPDTSDVVTHQWFIGWLEREGQSPLAFAVVYHARTEKAAGLTAAKTAGAFLSAWCAR